MFERLLQFWPHFRVWRTTCKFDKLKDSLLLLGFIGNEFFGASAGADLGDVAPAVKSYGVQAFVALKKDNWLVDGGRQHELLGD